MKKKSCIVLILIISVLSGCSSNTGGKETINQLKTTASGTVIEEVTTGGAITKSNNKGELFPRDYCEETDIEINGRQYKYIKYYY